MSVRRRKWTDPKTGKPCTVWMIDIQYKTPEGQAKRIRKFATRQTRRAAEAEEREIRDALIAGLCGRGKEVDDVVEDAEAEVPSLEAFSEEFMVNYAETTNKLSEVLGKRSMLRNHVVPWFGKQKLCNINSRDIARFKTVKLKDGYSKKTVNNLLVLLGRMLSIAVEWEIIDKAPKMKMLKIPRPEFDFLDFDESERLIDAAPERWRPMILMALKTGMRLGELLAVRWEDIDLVSKRILVRRNAVYGEIGTPKSGKNREIPICDTLLAELKGLRHLKGELVFSNDRGRLWLAQDTYSPLHWSCKKAGLRKVGWHVLRHTFASHLVMRGAPIKAVQELLGHSTLEMTMRYAHLSPDARREAVQLLNSRGTYTAHGNMENCNYL